MGAILSTYYNPMNWASRRENYFRFKEELGHDLLTIECAFGSEPFTLKDSVKLRASSPLWMKERLLMIGVELLPKDQDFVLFADADITWENKNFLEETKKLLKEYKAVQPFKTVHRRFKDWSVEKTYTSFAHQYAQGIVSDDFETEGHPGFALAVRREDFTIYDKSIAGTGDSLMMQALVGRQRCRRNLKILNGVRLQHYLEWADKCYKRFQGSLTYLDGSIDHMWHGSIKDRKYYQRMVELNRLNFNPYLDIETNDQGLLELNRSDIRNWVKNYLLSRNEDS
jgi:hypothetical protein